MSNLEITAIVLCAAFFFVQTSSTKSFSSLDEGEVESHINYARVHIARRAGELRHKLLLIKMLPIGRNDQTIDQMRSNIENDVALARDFVDDIIENATSSFNETECRSYFIDYEKAAQDVISHLDVYIISAINVTLTKVEKAIGVADAATEKLERLKIEASGCHGNRCYEIIYSSKFTLTDTLQETNSALCNRRSQANGSEVNKFISLESRYFDYDKKSINLIEKTLDCVNSSH